MRKLLLAAAAIIITSCSSAPPAQSPAVEQHSTLEKPVKKAQGAKEAATNSPEPSGQKYVLDKDHTTIMFAVSHLGFSNMIGTFKSYDGYFIFNEKEPERSFVDVTLKPGSIVTSSAALDKELQGKDWFNSAKFPTARFKSSQVKVTDDNHAEVTGWFTMLGITKAVKLDVTFNKTGTHPLTGQTISGFRATTTIKRSDYGMISYVPLVGDHVDITIETEGIAVK